jgi:hypothetical protein
MFAKATAQRFAHEILSWYQTIEFKALNSCFRFPALGIAFGNMGTA